MAKFPLFYKAFWGVIVNEPEYNKNKLLRFKNVWKILKEIKTRRKGKNQGLVLFWDLPDFLWILSIYRDLPDLFFSTFLAHRKDLQGAFLKASGTQSGPFSSEPEAGHIKTGP